MSNTEQRIADLEARLAKVEASPKVAPYIDGGQWPRRIMFGTGTVSSGEQDKLAFEKVWSANPKAQQLVAAEEAAAVAQVAFDAAQRAWIEESRTEQGGRYMSSDAFGGKMVEDIPADALITGRPDLPSYQTFAAAERAMIQARVKMYRLQREHDAERQRWEEKRNPSANKPKDGKDSSWSSRVRIAGFGGSKRAASSLR